MPRAGGRKTTREENNGQMPEGSRGPELRRGWEEKFFKALEETGGYHRAARAAGVSPTTIQKYRDMSPEFDARCRQAREYHADVLEERMEEQAAEFGNPVGYIVRLKALRPADYIEKHAIARMSFNFDAGVDDQTALEFLRRMMGSATDATKAVLAGEPLPQALPDATDAPVPRLP